MNATKQERVDSCNLLLREIGDRGRRFFRRPESWPGGDPKYARFELRRGSVYFVDDYSGKAIYTARARGSWSDFSHGGTLRDLVIKLSGFIRTGSTLAPGYFGPWPQYTCDGDLWGYGTDMAKVRQAALQHGIVAFKNRRAAHEWAGLPTVAPEEVVTS